MPTQDGLGAFLLPVMLILLLGFMFWTQRRRQRSVQAVQSSLAVGDEVCTSSGLFGRITGLDELTATLEIAVATEVRFDRRAIATRVESAVGGTGPGAPGRAGEVSQDRPAPGQGE